MKKVSLTQLFIICILFLLSACEKNIDINMVFVEGGTYTMGSTDPESDSDEQPLHQIYLNDFYISKYEVTQAEWESVMGYNPSCFKGEDLPVECVSYDNVKKFISKLNEKTGKRYRLPTEAEWEYAARGGNKSNRYKYSGDENIDRVSWYNDNSAGQPRLVGEKAPNELGIYDMSGNIHEWCSDWYDSTYYAKSPIVNPQGQKSGKIRVFRGGSWHSDKKYCRVTNRSHTVSETKNYSLGFRIAEDAR
ncbi:MAG: formylglycine-generating enzyme family protein [Prevotella sp.]|jgi:formylglycine-generating enzyme required for sulfatase activity|nr:formylglycine-generating enzyme family protein [Prevotella sp.]